MNKFFLFLFGFVIQLNLLAQQEYFQQEVNYKIDVKLDDQKHILNGTIEIEYTNNSPDELASIYFHLWGNAFKNKETAFAKQKLRTNSTRFHFAKDNQLGYYSDLDFKVNNQSIRWIFDSEHPDIALLTLNEPLKSGAKITITTPINLKIPDSFSRLGHVETSYQMTQWYPKPAVYDRDGWHQMPYLDMGEFYSEFGSFDVKITLPDNYVVGATGVLQTESEKVFLQEKVIATEKLLDKGFGIDTSFPPSSSTMKTLHYTAENVHDFAWFADKRFHVLKSDVSLISGRTVDTWAMFTNKEAELWKKGTDYLDRSVKFYSDLVGEYPWPHATAVQSALSAGAGMEYPMITVIGNSGTAKALDGVITHEVGHNWFYGILASNERTNAWMDEGMNSYYDHRYSDLYYKKDSRIIPEFVMAKSDLDEGEIGYLFQARRNVDQSCCTHSDDFTTLNYGLSAYEKPAKILKFLENYVGTERYDQIMQAYYEKWKFKHPQPDDFRTHWENETGKDLSWFFSDFVCSNKKMDYAITSMSKDNKVVVNNKGDINAPFSISGLKNGEIVQTKWYEGFDGKKELDFPAGDYDELQIDAIQVALEAKRSNNNLKTKGLLKTVEPIQLKFLLGIENPKRSTLYWLPSVAWNNYDKTMIGLGLYNATIPAKNFEFGIAPMYSLVSKELVGSGFMHYNIYPKEGFLQKIKLAVSGRSFHNSYNWLHDYRLRFYKLSPSITFDLDKEIKSKFYQSIQLRSILLWQETANFENAEFTGTDITDAVINEVSYMAENRRAINPYNFRLALEQQNYTSVFGDKEQYLKASAEFNIDASYKQNKNISFRFFAGGFLSNSRKDASAVSDVNTRGSFGMTNEGYNDYKYDEYYLGRSDQSGIWSQQVALNDGGFKNALGSANRLTSGQSNTLLVALNIKADLPPNLPRWLPLKPYFDIGYFDYAHAINTVTTENQLMYSGGLMLDYFDGILGIYFPLVNSQNINDLYSSLNGGKYGSRISFSLNLNKANPWRLIDRIEF